MLGSIKIKTSVLLIFVVVLFFSSAHATTSNEIWASSQYFIDESGTQSAAQVLALQSEFKPLMGPAKFGRTDSHIWIQVDLSHLSEFNELWLELNNPAIDNIELYQVNTVSESALLLYKTGDALPFKQRPINYRSFAFPIDNSTGEQFLFHVWGQTPLMLPLYAATPENFVSKLNLNMGAISALIGLIFAMVMYNLFLYVGTGIKEYGWYVIYVGNIWLFTVFANGFAYQYLWPNSPTIQNTLSYLFVGFFQWGAYNFARSFLNTRLRLPRFDRVLGILALLPLLIFPSFFVSAKISYLLITANTLLLFFIIPTVSIWVWLKGLQVAGIYLLSWTFVITGMLVYNLTITGVVPLSFWSQHGLEIGVAIESILLSFALAVRIRLQEESAQNNAHQAKLSLEKSYAETQEALALAQHSIAAKDNFLTSVSHELKTPIHSVFGNLQLLALEQLKDNQMALVQSADAAAIRLFYHIDNLLTYSEITAGDIQKDVQRISMADEVDLHFQIWKQIAADNHVNITLNLDSAIPKHIDCDWSHTRTIIRIALENAIKYSPADSNVHLSLEWQSVDEQTFVRFNIVDEGPGVSGELNKWFIDDEPEKLRVESGLGLYLCKHLVHVVNGKASLTNREDGLGASFKISVPVTMVHQTDKTVKSPGDSLNDKKILVVDDVAINLRVLEAMLKKLALSVDSASSGQQAIDMLRAQHYDLILMDCYMPNMSGQEACELIRQMDDPQKANIPVVAISANASDSDRKGCLKAGMNDFIAKPARMHRLKVMLEKYLV